MNVQGEFIPPILTTAERGAITNPKNGSVIYNSDTKSLESYDSGSTSWGVVGANSFPEHYFTEIDVASLNTTTAFIQRISLSFTPSAGNYIIQWCYDLGNQEKKKSEARVQLDNNATSLQVVQNKVDDNGTYESYSGFKKVTLTNAPHTVDIDFRKAEGAGDAIMNNSRILVYKIG